MDVLFSMGDDAGRARTTVAF